MALSDSGRAIGAVTRLLREHLLRRGFNVTIGKPEAASDTTDKLNLFLYECGIEGHLRNVSLQPGRPAPIWLTLRYLLTALDAGEASESTAAQELLGRGAAALHELNFLGLDAAVAADVRLALQDNPEALTLTFEEASPDLLSKVMSGKDETYRLSMAFQVRPVMIAPNQPEPFSGVVGVDVTTAPPVVIGRAGIGIAVLASLGPSLSRLRPPVFDPGEVLVLEGDDLHLSGLEARLGEVPIRITAQRPDRITLVAEGQLIPGMTQGPIAGGGTISAGEHALTLLQALPNGRFRRSNLLLARLRPVVASAALDGAGTLTVQGTLLGRWEDDILLALQRDGMPPLIFEAGLAPPTVAPARSIIPGAGQKTLTVNGLTGVAAGEWRVVVRVNGQQARAIPTVTVV
ncbi:MAG TPA: Pvc16 family protein [Roseomonas sp.]|jgi:hypothetical protein